MMKLFILMAKKPRRLVVVVSITHGDVRRDRMCSLMCGRERENR